MKGLKDNKNLLLGIVNKFCTPFGTKSKIFPFVTKSKCIVFVQYDVDDARAFSFDVSSLASGVIRGGTVVITEIGFVQVDNRVVCFVCLSPI